MLTSDNDENAKVVKFPIQAETEREWRLDDIDETPQPANPEKEWKLDDGETINVQLDLQDKHETINVELDLQDDLQINQTHDETTLPENAHIVAAPVDTLSEKLAVYREAAIPEPTTQPKKKSHWKVYGALLGAAVLSVWYSQQSINAYWQQTYHRPSPLESLNHFSLWKLGAKMQDSVNGLLGSSDNTENSTQNHAENHAPSTTKLPEKPKAIVQKAKNVPVEQTVAKPKETEPTISTQVTENKENSNENNVIWLNSGDKVLFAGDSIMQGIAPHVQRWLKNDYHIDSINLSKQSTGLAYPKFFDWVGTIEQNIAQDPNIKLIIILVGANDPWDFPNPNGGAYLKFATPEWNEVYLSRVNKIVQVAEKNHTKIIWLGAPYMRRPDLDKGVRHINKILGEELVKQNQTVLWLPTDMLLSDKENYQDNMLNSNGESIRVRAKDGIHLNPAGQIFISNYLNSYVKSK